MMGFQSERNITFQLNNLRHVLMCMSKLNFMISNPHNSVYLYLVILTF